MRSFLMGTLLVATVWANEEPTSRCEAWGYGREERNFSRLSDRQLAATVAVARFASVGRASALGNSR